MKRKFEIEFLDEALEFLDEIDLKARNKIIYNIVKSTLYTDPKLFKKLTKEIWEFRTLFQKKQYRLFAFWDKSNGKNVVVISTHGIVKKTGKVDKKELLKAENIRSRYFDKKN